MEESGQKKTKAERIAARQARQAAGGQRKQGARALPAEQTRMPRDERQGQQAAQEAERERARAERNEQYAAQMQERKESNRQQDRRTALAAAANSLGPETPTEHIFKRAEELLVWLKKSS